MNEKCLPSDDPWRQRAKALIDRQKTLVLATSDQNRPWAAPVYYIQMASAFFFFSNPKSTHIIQARDNRISSAALFSDADRWEQIEGIQMVGRIEAISKKTERLRVTVRYLKKFPTAQTFLSGKGKVGLDISGKVGLFAFYPERMLYMNNQMGFGSRIEINPMLLE